MGLQNKSPEASLFTSIMTKLTSDVPELRYIEQDFGQLESYEMRPAVSWPCCLVDIEEGKFSDQGNFKIQLAEGLVSLRIGLVKYTDTNNLTPPNIRAASLQYYELENKVYTALHGWNPPGFSKLLRRANGTEKRDDDIRVRIIKFAVSYTDYSAKDQLERVPRPNPVLGSDIIPNS